MNTAGMRPGKETGSRGAEPTGSAVETLHRRPK